ncbi:MAG: hypothetical protein AVDCRST_MAG73-4073 [uncultured Thermomicrobiales bacterium]|uniref:PIN domain-containing protein n=1 Tax=uncultured Thermomicrobiales bacterium TaxID=1645740 RepID=A0A6J4V0A2_9BACT|nr:MAG: hypothetical protein AVDCRST_MAG73-4073 [uncultured Thermomicrobiales bacterium]
MTAQRIVAEGDALGCHSTLEDVEPPAVKTRRRRFDVNRVGFASSELWIAATARGHGLVIVSSDRDVVRIGDATGIATESWLTHNQQP